MKKVIIIAFLIGLAIMWLVSNFADQVVNALNAKRATLEWNDNK
jgi:hypothetical protein